mmetsp:Transcript_4747/g.5188  ORF Transcript_4747/g.5188 Transcript_4747/m.5188 type:complete len:229 (+) Transcript_4747:22-708(+)
MSVKHPELQIPKREAVENTPAYTLFCDSQQELLRIWESQCNKVFKESSEKLVGELKDKTTKYQEKLNSKLYKSQGVFNALYDLYMSHRHRLTDLMVFKKNISRWYYHKKTQRYLFEVWRYAIEYKKYLRRMKIYSRNFFKRRLTKTCMKNWKNFTYNEIRLKQQERWAVKLTTETEQLKIEYSQIIENLQQLYKKRLHELEEEESAHKDMFARFSSYTEIKKLEGAGH